MPADSTSTRSTRDDLEDIFTLAQKDVKSSSELRLPAPIRKLTTGSRHDAGDNLESFFQETITSSTRSPPIKQATYERPQNIMYSQSSSSEPYKNAEILKTMIAERQPINESWAFFITHFGHHGTEGPIDPATMPAYLKSTGHAMLYAITKAKTNKPESETLPSAAVVTKIFLDMGILKGYHWAQLIRGPLETIIKAKELTENVYLVFLDLIASWNIMSRLATAGDRGLGPPFSWKNMKTYTQEAIQRRYQSNGLTRAFCGIFPVTATAPPKETEGIPLVALATFRLLATANPSCEKITHLIESAHPLMWRLSRWIDACDITTEELNGVRLRTPSPMEYYVKSDLARIKELASAHAAEDVKRLQTARIQTERRGAAGDVRPEHLDATLLSDRWTSKFKPVKDAIDPFFMRQALEQADSRRDRDALDRLWQGAIKFPLVNSSPLRPGFEVNKTPEKIGYLTSETCCEFIRIHMKLRDPDRAIIVWNHMVENGCHPDLMAWNAMLKGAQQGRDLSVIEGVWNRMMRMGVRPDIHCWTSRVSGLGQCWHRDGSDACIRALDEMGRAWLAATKEKHGEINSEKLKSLGDVDGCVKPSIVPVNAAVVSLLRHQKEDAAHRILAWAGRFGIAPDLTTYNILLRFSVRNGKTQQVSPLLHQMSKQGLEADAATFTTILDEIFRDAQEKTPREQWTIVTEFLTSMEVAGVQCNMQVYGKIIYLLLQNCQGDLTGVNAVLQKMSTARLKPNSYVWTMLLQHHFRRDPPELEAVEAIVKRAQVEVGIADSLFWMVVLDNYVRIGDWPSALRHMQGLLVQGIRPKLETMLDLCLLLVNRNEWEAARGLARQAVQERVDLRKPENERSETAQHFWDMCAELKFLE